MLTKIKSRTAALAAIAVLATSTAGGLAVAGCGGTDTPTQPSSTAPAASSPDGSGSSTATNPIPQSVLAAESGAEDTIDLLLAGDTAKALDSAKALNDVARGQAASDLADAGVSKAQIAEFQSRAAEVAKLAPTAEPLDTALASNRVFELVSQFLGRYDDLVPSEVIKLDYLDFEAKLQALAGDRTATEAVVSKLTATWNALEAEVVAAGGDQAAASFKTHVTAMQDLVVNGSDQQLADEAQHGLDLVDEIEVVYTG